MRKLVAFLALILLAGSAARAEGLFLDFEHGRMGIWRFLPKGFAQDSLGLALDGLSPIRVTPRTKVAWCWWVSENEKMSARVFTRIGPWRRSDYCARRPAVPARVFMC